MTLFEQIIDGEIPSTTVYEDEHTYAFLDTNPVNRGHTLVVPKEPYRDIYDIPEDVLCHVMNTVKKLAPAIKSTVDADGINLHVNNEAAAGQMVFHFHVHIIPRFDGDGFEDWHGTVEYDEGEADTLARDIHSYILKSRE